MVNSIKLYTRFGGKLAMFKAEIERLHAYDINEARSLVTLHLIEKFNNANLNEPVFAVIDGGKADRIAA